MPYNSPMKKKGSSCMQMKDYKGKPSGLMMEGSAMHMSMLHRETEEQEAKNDLNDMPVDDKASAMEMSPYKMDHGSPAKITDPKIGEQELDEVVVTLPEYHKKKLGMYDPGMPELEKGISGRYQFRSASGGVDPNPSKAFTKGLGEMSIQGAPGRSFTQKEAEEIQNRYKTYIKPKKDAQAYFESRK